MRMLVIATLIALTTGSDAQRRATGPTPGAAKPPAPAQAAAAPAPPKPSSPTPAVLVDPSGAERFLEKARILKTHSAGSGVTGSLRATLSDGTLTHDASIQTVDEQKAQFIAGKASEFNFQDSWRFNVAAYRIDRLIGLNMVPPSVERRYDTQPAAFTWWIDDVLMDEAGRLKSKSEPPRPAEWNEQMQLLRLFDQLIYNVDRNLGNLLIDRNWRIWAIDHTRAFRLYGTLKTPENVTRCDRALYARLKALDEPTVKKAMGDYISSFQIKALLERRDAIIARLDALGPTALFDRRLP